MIEFNEKRADFKGFSSYYRENIHLRLIELDLGRKDILRKYKLWIVGGIIGGIIFTIITIMTGLGGIGLMIGFGIFAFGLANANAAKKPLYLDTKNAIVGGTAQYLGWSFTPEGFVPQSLDRYKSLGLLPKEDRKSFEDEIRGNAHGAKFVLHEAHLERKNDKSYSTIFRGIMIALEFPQNFAGTTLVLRRGIFKWKTKKGLKRVGLVDPVFEKAFDAYGSDQVEARYLLTPTFMQRLVDLETLFKGKKIRAAFHQGELLICIETGNQFEPGSLFQPLTGTWRTERLLNEFGLIFDIVDGVLKPEANRIDYKSNIPTTGT